MGGVRKKKVTSSGKYTPSARIQMSLKTKNGEVLTASQYKQSKITSFLAKHNLKIQKQVENTKNFELKNEKGDVVGNLQLLLMSYGLALIKNMKEKIMVKLL